MDALAAEKAARNLASMDVSKVSVLLRSAANNSNSKRDIAWTRDEVSQQVGE